MSAKNVSDIGGTVTNILDAQDKRGLHGLQSRFTQAQTDQIQAKIEAMPLKEFYCCRKLIFNKRSVESGVTQEKKHSSSI
jgi:hypothetical protein